MCQSGDEVVLPLPSFLARYRPNNTKDVCIDRCIVGVILELWKSGIHTLGCCCGHDGKMPGPDVIVGSMYGDGEIEDIRRILKKVGAQEWDILQWRLECACEAGVDGAHTTTCYKLRSV